MRFGSTAIPIERFMLSRDRLQHVLIKWIFRFAMGLFRCVRLTNNTSKRAKHTAANDWCRSEHDASKNGNRCDRNDVNDGMARTYRKRRIYSMDGLLVVAIILTVLVDGRCGVDATAPITSLPQSVTNTISHSQSLRTTRFTPISTTAMPATFTRNSSGGGGKTKATALAKGTGGSIRETLVIPSSNSEREAQEIYDKALKQFDAYGASTRKVCDAWEERGCQCSGTVEELILSCRAIGLNETPTDLPKNLIKL